MNDSPLVRLRYDARHTLRTFAAMTKADLTANSNYRAQLIVTALQWVLPLVMMALWRAVYPSPTSKAEITTYFVSILIITALDPTPMVPFEFGDLVREGKIGAMLLRPINPMWAILARSASYSAYSIVTAGALGIITTVVLHGTVTTNPLAWLLALVTLVEGMVAMGMIITMVASLSFWTTKAAGLQSFSFAARGLIGGIYVPLAVVGGTLGDVIILQPYWLSLGGPAELIAGMRAPSEMTVPLLVGWLWILVLIPLTKTVWKRGVLRSETVGG